MPELPGTPHVPIVRTWPATIAISMLIVFCSAELVSDALYENVPLLGSATQVMEMSLTSVLPTMPAPFVTLHAWRNGDDGLVTATAYDWPLGTGVLNMKRPSAATSRL